MFFKILQYVILCTLFLAFSLYSRVQEKLNENIFWLWYNGWVGKNNFRTLILQGFTSLENSFTYSYTLLYLHEDLLNQRSLTQFDHSLPAGNIFANIIFLKMVEMATKMCLLSRGPDIRLNFLETRSFFTVSLLLSHEEGHTNVIICKHFLFLSYDWELNETAMKESVFCYLRACVNVKTYQLCENFVSDFFFRVIDYHYY